jgi:HD-GYP domain-containing protein (c-di-GMP phosphodiesterase class II)
MLKRINVKQLVIGMYLKEFCGAWMDHPFWRKGFLITDPKDITTILASSIVEVWIDSSKGLDVAPGQSIVTEQEVEIQVTHQLEASAALPAVAPLLVEHEAVTAKQEFDRAAKICSQGKQAMTAMFQEARMGKTLDTAEAQEVVHAISDSVARNASALISLARLKTADDYTYMHSVAVCAMMVALARQLKLSEPEVRAAGMAGLMHDLGKALMPMAVLNKPGKLTDAEFAIIRTHPVEGHKMMLAAGGIDAFTRDVCLHHHEKMDGSGYPDKLKGDGISLFAKMAAVCDVYDAITSNRPYKSGWDPAESLRKMAEWANGHFDPKVFQAFVRSLGIYPIGSLVRLTSGRIGVVVEQGSKSLTQPQVKVFFSTKSNLRIPSEVIDLSSSLGREKIEGREDPAKWRFPDLDELWSGLDKKPW